MQIQMQVMESRNAAVQRCSVPSAGSGVQVSRVRVQTLSGRQTSVSPAPSLLSTRPDGETSRIFKVPGEDPY